MSKIILTGGPCSGKSTLVEVMRNKGFSTISEVAKDMIEKIGISCLTKGQYITLQDEIAQEQVRREEKIDEKKITILDRGIYDSLAYCGKYLGFVPVKTQELIAYHKGYDQIFLLDRLNFIKGGYRIENDESEAIELHERIKKVYEEKGYRLTRIPVMSIEKRVEYLMERIE